jgi:branched-subunit amino acid ABC-type transport system permease component
MEEFFQQLTNGLAVGAIYALIALGYTMVYGVLKLINFAHGELFTIGSSSHGDGTGGGGGGASGKVGLPPP